MRDRKKRRDEVESIVTGAVLARSFDDATFRLKAAGVGCTEVKSMATVLDEPQARQPGKLAGVKFHGFEFAVPNMPIPRQIAADAEIAPPPLLGEHTQVVLQSLGYSVAECDVLEASGVIAMLKTEQKPLWAPPRPQA